MGAQHVPGEGSRGARAARLRVGEFAQVGALCGDVGTRAPQSRDALLQGDEFLPVAQPFQQPLLRRVVPS